MHIENLGGDIDAPELQNTRLILGCFPWKFRGGEAAFCPRRGLHRRAGSREPAPACQIVDRPRRRDLATSSAHRARCRRARCCRPSRERIARVEPGAERHRHDEPTAPTTRPLPSTPRWPAARRRGRCAACRSASRTSPRWPALRTTYGSPLFADHVPDRGRAGGHAAPARRRDHPRQDQLPGVRRRRQHLQRGVRAHAQSLGSRPERRRIDRRRRRGAGHRHDRAGRRHRPRRVAAHPGVVLRRRRAASVGRAGADGADRLGVGHAAGQRADGADGRATSR